MSRRLAYATLAWLLVGWVLPPDRVVREMARIREKQPAIRAEAVLIGHDPSWPEEVLLELHPEYGTRVLGDQGERWRVLGGGVVGRTPGREGRADAAPRWLPDLEPLMMRDPNGLVAWLEETHVDPEVTELARCEDADCFVLGGRTAAAQVWVDKDRFELRRVQSSPGRAVEAGDYTDWHHIAAVGRDNKTRFFVDGKYVGQIDFQSKSDIWRIGAWPGQRFARLIDNVRVYSRALQDSEVTANQPVRPAEDVARSAGATKPVKKRRSGDRIPGTIRAPRKEVLLPHSTDLLTGVALPSSSETRVRQQDLEIGGELAVHTMSLIHI